jgi:hypothetical protein
VRRARGVAIAVLVLLAAAYLWWRLGTRHVPDGQPPLATMDVAALRDDFNRAAGHTRVIVLLSPT